MYKSKMLINIFVCTLLIVVFIISGCGKTETEATPEVESDGKMQIGLCFDSFIIERWEKDRDIFVSTARDLGAEVNVQNANGEVDEQIKQIEYFINKGVNAIVVISIDGTALQETVKKAQSKGIKVVAYDRMINKSGADLYISFDNEMVGTLMGEALAAELSDDNRKVLMMQGSPTDNNVNLVEKGFRSVMEKEGIEIVDSMYADGWKADLASDYLYDNPDILSDIGGIMCGNDNIASSVIRVLSEKRKAGKISLVGQDADLEACQRIVEGTQSMTVYKPVEKEAEAAARGTVALIRGEEIENLSTISDGKYDIPGVILNPIAVTKNNMDEIIVNTGFHMEEEVYMNVKR